MHEGPALMGQSKVQPQEEEKFQIAYENSNKLVPPSQDMFGYALRHPKRPASNGRVNSSGFTPLTLSCQLGRATVFQEMLELSAREFWRYSNITCSAYPLNALDTLLPDGRTSESTGHPTSFRLHILMRQPALT